MKTHPRGREDLPLSRAFTARASHRPNPIGFTLVELSGVEGNVVKVSGLDAFGGTPILYLRFFDFWDMVEDARVPEWWTRLEKKCAEKCTVSR